MTVQVEFWALITLFLSFLGFLFAAGKLLLSQVDMRLQARFEAMEKARAEGGKHWDEKFNAIEDSMRDEAKKFQHIERELLTLKADLPLQYVRREDYVRNQTVIEAKLDAVALKIENLQLKGAHRD